MSNAEIVVELDDCVHGAVHQALELFLAFVQFLLGPQPEQFGNRTIGEDTKEIEEKRLLRHRTVVQNRKVAQDAAVGVEQWDAHVTDRG